ncbi:1,4-beta-xylanase [Chitinophaga sp. Mgbs1]|uniref:1,4-beta-xylanase n=1 Tax=Chitinophaga solisilvae TaxID=1233460 RepID=A0A433WQ13_9BACT|nr:1,4-beta-xylanase [Chitinophaga solisilvae]
MRLNTLTAILLCILHYMPSSAQSKTWTAEQANTWYRQQPWMTGANFTPSTAVNQLEMWQAATFDTATISRELGWAAGIGMNCMRVYLHHVAWQEDSSGFKNRIDQYLAIADRYHIRTMFVFFDDCWNNDYAPGPQPAPKPSVHNSGWLKDPGDRIDTLPLLMDTLQRYVKDILNTYKNDPRICIWDLYNEPAHFGHGDKSWPLLRNVVAWARSIALSQPVTIGVWSAKFPDFNEFQLRNSDIITFHNYRDTTSLLQAVDTLTTYGKPVICTEYMKRPANSLFKTHLPIFRNKNIGAINWGLVAGKTQTWYPQGNKGGEAAPVIWYHDIFQQDGTPHQPEEVKIIRQLTQINETLQATAVDKSR